MHELSCGSNQASPPLLPLFLLAACLSLVGVQLVADSVGPAELLLQLAGALHVHSVSLLQEAHLSAQVSQILQLPLVRLHQSLELVHPVRRVPEGEESRAWAASSTRTGISLLTKNIRVEMYLTTETTLTQAGVNAWNSHYQHRCQRGAEWTSVCGQCGSCFCEEKLIIDEL